MRPKYPREISQWYRKGGCPGAMASFERCDYKSGNIHFYLVKYFTRMESQMNFLVFIGKAVVTEYSTIMEPPAFCPSFQLLLRMFREPRNSLHSFPRTISGSSRVETEIPARARSFQPGPCRRSEGSRAQEPIVHSATQF